jgi:hypothetical protein
MSTWSKTVIKIYTETPLNAIPINEIEGVIAGSGCFDALGLSRTQFMKKCKFGTK